jgi:hypothetical protein
VDGGHEILTMQDIDKISKELILPSLNMTKSSSFIPNQYNQYQLENNAIDSPYFGNVNTNNISNSSPNQRLVHHSVFNKNG